MNILPFLFSRFLANLPPDEYAAPERFFFHLEEAFWFYTDFHNPLPPLTFPGNLFFTRKKRRFSTVLFFACRILPASRADVSRHVSLSCPAAHSRPASQSLSFLQEKDSRQRDCLSPQDRAPRFAVPNPKTWREQAFRFTVMQHAALVHSFLWQTNKKEKTRDQSLLQEQKKWRLSCFVDSDFSKQQIAMDISPGKNSPWRNILGLRAERVWRGDWNSVELSWVEQDRIYGQCETNAHLLVSGIQRRNARHAVLSRGNFTSAVGSFGLAVFSGRTPSPPLFDKKNGCLCSVCLVYQVVASCFLSIPWLETLFLRLLRASTPFSSRLSELCVQQWRDYVTSQLPDGDTVDETRHAKSSTNVGDGITHAVSSMPDKPTCTVSSVCVANEKRLPSIYTTPPTQPNNKTKDGDNTKDTNQDAMVDTTRNHTREENPLLDFRFDVDAIMALVDPTKW